MFGVLLAILEVHGFTAVQSGNLYKIIRIEGARERAVPTIVGATAGSEPHDGRDRHADRRDPVSAVVNELGALLRPLISTRGTLIAHRETNVLIITDTASNITRLLDIIRLVDVEVAQDELQIIPRHVRRRRRAGDDPQPALRQRPHPRDGARHAAGAGGARRSRRACRCRGAPPAQPGGSAEAARPLIIPERRSNSLIVHAKKHEVETIRRLVIAARRQHPAAGGACSSTTPRTPSQGPRGHAERDLRRARRDVRRRPRRRGALDQARPPPPPYPAGHAADRPAAPRAGRRRRCWPRARCASSPTRSTNAVIVTTFPRSWTEIEDTRSSSSTGCRARC